MAIKPDRLRLWSAETPVSLTAAMLNRKLASGIFGSRYQTSQSSSSEEFPP
jgi:hypothetical protein